MHRLALQLFVVGAAIVLAVPLVARQSSASAIEARIARIEAELPNQMIMIKGQPKPGTSLIDRMAFHKTPGVSIAVIDNGVVAWTRAYGVLEAGGAARVMPRTIFQAASISKSVAAFTAMRAVEQGRLALDEDVNARLTSWKVPETALTVQEKVTLRRLLSHTAGTNMHGVPGYATGVTVPSIAQILAGAAPADNPPVRVEAAPGSAYRYSGGGYTVVQQLLVDALATPFPDVTRDLTLRPIGMTDSGFEQPLPARLQNNAASGHTGDYQVVAGKYQTYPASAAAGLWTTAPDLARFAVEIQRGSRGQSALLSPATAALLLTPVKAGYGLGVFLQGTGRAARFSHGGSNPGFRSSVVAYLETGQGAAVMTNATGGELLAAEILRSIAREYKWPELAPTEKTLTDVDAATLRHYVGRYESAPNLVFIVTLEDGRLIMRTSGRPDRTLLPESPTRFFSIAPAGVIEFFKGSDGAVTHLVINGQRASRLP